jgi:hypothetical protein
LAPIFSVCPEISKRVIYFDAMAYGVAYMASLSLEANVQFMTVMPTKCPMSVVADAS